MPYTEVMHKFGTGTLRSSSGQPVRSKAQALAIMESEKRAAENGKTEYQPSGGQMEHARKPEKKTLGGKSFTSHPGRLHRELGIPLGEKIGEERERKALKSSKPQVRRDARSALGYAAMRKG